MVGSINNESVVCEKLKTEYTGEGKEFFHVKIKGNCGILMPLYL